MYSDKDLTNSIAYSYTLQVNKKELGIMKDEYSSRVKNEFVRVGVSMLNE